MQNVGQLGKGVSTKDEQSPGPIPVRKSVARPETIRRIVSLS